VESFYADQCGFPVDVDVSPFEGGRLVRGGSGATGREGKGEGDWNSFVFFKDPDGNGWVVQEMPAPLARR
jgi:hypothetical protein